jgi:hypothetical protein
VFSHAWNAASHDAVQLRVTWGGSQRDLSYPLSVTFMHNLIVPGGTHVVSLLSGLIKVAPNLSELNTDVTYMCLNHGYHLKILGDKRVTRRKFHRGLTNIRRHRKKFSRHGDLASGICVPLV